MSNQEKIVLIDALKNLLPSHITPDGIQNLETTATLLLALKRLEKLDPQLSTELGLIFITLTRHISTLTENDLENSLLELQERLRKITTEKPLTSRDDFWETF